MRFFMLNGAFNKFLRIYLGNLTDSVQELKTAHGCESRNVNKDDDNYHCGN